MPRACLQLLSLECWGGATFDVVDEVSHRGPVGAARASPREGSQHPYANVAARRQWRRLHQLSRQCRSQFRSTGRRRRHGRLPHFRLPELGRKHARRYRRRLRNRQAGRRRDLLHRRYSRSGPYQIFAPLLCRPGQGVRSGGLPYPRPQRHGRTAEARRGEGSGQGAERGGRVADPSSYSRHVRDFGRDSPGRRRCGRGRDRRCDGRDVRRDLAALPRLAGRSLASYRP